MPCPQVFIWKYWIETKNLGHLDFVWINDSDIGNLRFKMIELSLLSLTKYWDSGVALTTIMKAGPYPLRKFNVKLQCVLHIIKVKS